MKKKIFILMFSLLCALCLPFASAGCEGFGKGTGGNNPENTQNGNTEGGSNADNGGSDNNAESGGSSGENGAENNGDKSHDSGNTDNNSNNGGSNNNPGNGSGNTGSNGNGPGGNGGENSAENNGNRDNSDSGLGAIKKYTVYTESASGSKLTGVTVKVTRNGADVTSKAATLGYAQFDIAAGDYDLSYENLPEGYYADPSYTAAKLSKDGSTVHARFKSQVISEPLGAPYKYKQGDVMHNFSFTDSDGTRVELKALLKTYKLVLLNFWYDGCYYCEQELPAIEKAYKNHKNEVFIVAVSNRDTNAEVKRYKNNHGCTFFMAADSENIVSQSFVSAYPTNVFIDPYGVVNSIDVGARTDSAFWESKFSEYSSRYQ